MNEKRLRILNKIKEILIEENIEPIFELRDYKDELTISISAKSLGEQQNE